MLVGPTVAQAKSDLFIRLGGYYSYSRLERASSVSGGSFSLISQDGYQGALTLGRYFTKHWSLYLTGMHFAHDYKAPPSRELTMPKLPIYSGGLGTEFIFGDFSFYLQGNYRTLPVIDDLASTEHKLYAVPVGTAQLGIRLKAYSAYGYEMEIDLAGATGALAGQLETDNSEVKLSYSLLGRAQLAFGSQKTAGISSIRFGSDYANYDTRYGFNLEILVDEFKHGTNTYTMTHLYGGLFMAFIF